jgi:hypothetical protein
MTKTRLSPLVVALVALVVVTAAVLAGSRLVRGDGSLLANVAFEQPTITPNADGVEDITLIRYELARNADVSIYFEDEQGQRYYFRREQPRGAGDYELYFSGVVEGYRLPREQVDGEIVARLLQNGSYRWVVEAVDENGVAEQASGTLRVAEADTILPEIRNFTLDRHEFTPNRDGIDDRVIMEFDLPKDVAQVDVFLLQEDGTRIPVPEKPMQILPGDAGRHIYDYAAAVDEGAPPPPDGTYPVVAISEDAEGQKVRVENTITIDLGGVPRAKIVSPVTGDTLAFSTTAVQLCDTLTFTVTVENYGATPIRTVGPWSGTVYDSDWNYNTMGWPTESGAWRLGIGYENALSDYPYRWGLGNPDELEKIGDHYYLMPGARAVITGGIRVVNRFGVRNPQPMWAGLIHEDVEISLFNNRVDPHSILVDLPDPGHMPQCEGRSIPDREGGG